MKITKKEWDSYVRVQDSGVTNMLDFSTVGSLTGLNRDTIIYIIENYQKLSEEFEAKKDNKNES